MPQLTLDTIDSLDGADATTTTDPTKYLTPKVIIGEVLITLAIITALFILYMTTFTSLATQRAQSDSRDVLASQWDSGQALTVPGDPGLSLGVAARGQPDSIMRAPRLGDQWEYVVYSGVDQDTLAKGPGWYPDGDRGVDGVSNHAIAGHRDGWNAPFGDLDAFETCDEITIETATATITYRVLPTATSPTERVKQVTTGGCFDEEMQAALVDDPSYNRVPGRHVVPPETTSAVYPIPGVFDPDATPARGVGLELLTLTTCHPHWSNAQRLIVHAVQTNVEYKPAV